MTATGSARVPKLKTGQVDVWHADLKALPAGEGPRALLGAEERARAEAFRFDRDRAAFVARRAWYRTMLGAYLECSPRDLEFTTWGNGKPRLAESGLHFNTSHSHGRALLAVTRDCEVGVDVEWCGRDLDIMPLVGRFFAPAEVAVFDGLAEAERRALFFRAWTCKEAYIKALAMGLSLPTQSFEVPLTGPGGPILTPEGQTDWQVRLLDLGPDYAGALALPLDDLGVNRRRWQ